MQVKISIFSPFVRSFQVNNVQVRGLTHKDASAILRKCEITAKLVLGRPKDLSFHFKSLVKEQVKLFSWFSCKLI